MGEFGVYIYIYIGMGTVRAGTHWGVRRLVRRVSGW